MSLRRQPVPATAPPMDEALEGVTSEPQRLPSIQDVIKEQEDIAFKLRQSLDSRQATGGPASIKTSPSTLAKLGRKATEMGKAVAKVASRRAGSVIAHAKGKYKKRRQRYQRWKRRPCASTSANIAMRMQNTRARQTKIKYILYIKSSICLFVNCAVHKS